MNRVFDVASAIVVVAGLLVMARPGSQGPNLVDSIMHGYEGALGVATGAGVTSTTGGNSFAIGSGSTLL